MDVDHIGPLILLASMGVTGRRKTRLRLTDIASAAGLTPQGASKLVKRLVERGLLVRFEDGSLAFTERAEEEMREAFGVLLRYFGAPLRVKLSGTVFTGLGEGRYYLSLEGYVRQFEEKLGFRPYPGTLNVRLFPEYIPHRRYLELLPGIQISGFSNGVRTYGGVKCFRAEVNGYPNGAVLIIERTHYGPDVIELVAPVSLRETLSLRDGDVVDVVANLELGL